MTQQSPLNSMLIKNQTLFLYAFIAFVGIVTIYKSSETATKGYGISPFYQHKTGHGIYTSTEYIPAPTEQTITDNFSKLSLDGQTNDNAGKACDMWKFETDGLNLLRPLHSYLEDLAKYKELEQKFFVGIDDLRDAIRNANGDSDLVCRKLRLHPDGLPGIFKSGQLSFTSSGFVEPLLPPMRHPAFCFDKDMLMDLGYIIHDYEAMCRKLKSHSKIILIDMGASTDFTARKIARTQAMDVWDQFGKYGFKFDHIYAFELKPHDVSQVFETVSPEYFPSYHWINVGVSADDGHVLNPLHSLLTKFTEDDLVIVKLDIDAPSIEIPFAMKLLESNDISRVVDHFYFEHHVKMDELLPYWGLEDTMTKGSVKDSMELFQALRRKGIASHFWI